MRNFFFDIFLVERRNSCDNFILYSFSYVLFQNVVFAEFFQLFALKTVDFVNTMFSFLVLLNFFKVPAKTFYVVLYFRMCYFLE